MRAESRDDLRARPVVPPIINGESAGTGAPALTKPAQSGLAIGGSAAPLLRAETPDDLRARPVTPFHEEKPVPELLRAEAMEQIPPEQRRAVQEMLHQLRERLPNVQFEDVARWLKIPLSFGVGTAAGTALTLLTGKPNEVAVGMGGLGLALDIAAFLKVPSATVVKIQTLVDRLIPTDDPEMQRKRAALFNKVFGQSRDAEDFIATLLARTAFGVGGVIGAKIVAPGLESLIHPPVAPTPELHPTPTPTPTETPQGTPQPSDQGHLPVQPPIEPLVPPVPSHPAGPTISSLDDMPNLRSLGQMREAMMRSLDQIAHAAIRAAEPLAQSHDLTGGASNILTDAIQKTFNAHLDLDHLPSQIDLTAALSQEAGSMIHNTIKTIITIHHQTYGEVAITNEQLAELHKTGALGQLLTVDGLQKLSNAAITMTAPK